MHSPYLMMGKDWWVVVFIQNFDYDSAGAVQSWETSQRTYWLSINIKQHKKSCKISCCCVTVHKMLHDILFMSADTLVTLCVWKKSDIWEPLLGSIKLQRSIIAAPSCCITTVTTSSVTWNYVWASQCEIWKKVSLITQTNQRKLHKMTPVTLRDAILQD